MNFLKIFFAVQLVLGFQKYSDKLDINESEGRSCMNVNCEYCCLSTYQCGSLEECKLRKAPVLILELYFYSLVAVCTFMILWQCVSKGQGVSANGQKQV